MAEPIVSGKFYLKVVAKEGLLFTIDENGNVLGKANRLIGSLTDEEFTGIKRIFTGKGKKKYTIKEE